MILHSYVQDRSKWRQLVKTAKTLMGALLDDDDEWRTGNGYSGVVLRAVAMVLFFTQVKDRGL